MPGRLLQVGCVCQTRRIDQVCIPFEDCLWDKELPPCNAPVCPDGQTYDQAKDCCAVPAALKQVCVSGLSAYFDPVKNQSYCVFPDRYEAGCETHSVKIKYCPTLTPTPTTPPADNGGGGPGCVWICPPTTACYCK